MNNWNNCCLRIMPNMKKVIVICESIFSMDGDEGGPQSVGEAETTV